MIFGGPFRGDLAGSRFRFVEAPTQESGGVQVVVKQVVQRLGILRIERRCSLEMLPRLGCIAGRHEP